ncbi:MAG: UDP-N-acetylmuramoyl-L-alanine--D-glutamate ligase [Gammaproteobacteria bacterium]|nr:MAG: UDP-N-acetylmuramoyl-L-alanine--D-glutamate ligase [Gammaproteobacteria bacterium]
MMTQVLDMVRNEHKRTLVVGLGKTGLSCVRYLRSRGEAVTVVDSRDIPPKLSELKNEFPEVEVRTGSFDESLFRNSDRLVVSPGVSVNEAAVVKARNSGKEIIGDIELFSQAATSPVIAITGSNGKSTVTTLVGKMCEAGGMQTAVGGNIGEPALSLLLGPDPEPAVYVLELSSFQLETVHSLNARAAVVLNISPDHMDRYDDLSRYVTAKQNIFSGNGTLVLNRDDARVMEMDRDNRQRVYFGLAKPESQNCYGIASHNGQAWIFRADHPVMPVAEVQLIGQHNIANVMAAMALAETMSIPFELMRETVKEFKGLSHRTEIVANYGDILWINDSKATNVGATTSALEGIERPVVLIAGGQSKNADFSVLRDAVVNKVHTLVLIGEDARKIASELENNLPLFYANNMEVAVRLANDHARAGDAVLLSPACASFDMFEGFEHRGDVFTHAVKALLTRQAETQP